MNSMRILILLAFVSYEMHSAQSTIKHFKYLKSLLLSKHFPSTTEQPVVEEELYPAFVQCEPTEGDANADAPIESTQEQKPVLIEIENENTGPNVYPGQYYGVVLPSASPEAELNPDENAGANFGTVTEGNPETVYLKAYEKDLNPEWLRSRMRIEQKPEIADIKSGVVSLKDKIREKINLIKTKLKLIRPEPKPIVEIIDQDTPFVPEQDDNGYFQYTTGKPFETAEPVTTVGQPMPAVESITTGRPASTAEWIASERPFSSTIESITAAQQPFGGSTTVGPTAAGPAVDILPKPNPTRPHPLAGISYVQRLPYPAYYYAAPYLPPLAAGRDVCPPHLTREMCRRRSVTTLENVRYVAAAPGGGRLDSRHWWQQLTNAVGGIVDPTSVDLRRVPYVDRPRPSTLENTRYVVVGGPRRPDLVSEVGRYAVVNRFENANSVGPRRQQQQLLQWQQQQLQQRQPPSPPPSTAAFENAYGALQAAAIASGGGPVTAARPSYAPPPPPTAASTLGLPEVGTIEPPSTGRPIAVYPDVVVPPTSSDPENDWARNMRMQQQQQGDDAPLRGDIRGYGSDEYGAAQATAVVEYATDATVERRQTKRDEAVTVDEKPVAIPAKVSGPDAADKKPIAGGAEKTAAAPAA